MRNQPQYVILISAVIGWLTFAASLIFPEQFWGTSYLATLPNWASYGLLIISFGLIILPISKLSNCSLPRPRNWMFVLIGLFFSAYCFLNPIPIDIYGDSVYIFHQLDLRIPEWDNRLITEPLEPDFFDTKCGLETFYQLNNFTSWLFGIHGREALKVLQTFFAFVFVMLWLSLCKIVFHRSASWFWLFALVGLTTPMLLAFMTHFESYYLTYTGIVGWILLLANYHVRKRKWTVYLLPFAFLLLIQTHITNWLLLPTLAVPLLLQFKSRIPLVEMILQPKVMRLLFGIPFLLVLGVAYFGIYQNYNGPRQFSEDDFENSLFLPLYTPEEPPLDRYNLFSVSHLIDYPNLALLSSGAFVLLLGLLFINKPKSDGSEFYFVEVLGITATCYAVAFFMLNPLLSPMIDWDLFILPWLVFLLYSTARTGQLQATVKPKKVVGPFLGLLILGMSFFPVHSSKKLLAKRYAVIGRRDFKTYWMGSSTANINAIDPLYSDPNDRKTAYFQLIQELEPFAVIGNDSEYAALLLKIGRIEKDASRLQSALSWMQEAERYEPDFGANLYYLTLVTFELKDYKRSLKYVSRLIELRYQPFKRMLAMGVHIALAARDYQAAANFSVMYLNRWDDNQGIAEVEYRLRNGINIEEILNDVFQRPKDDSLVENPEN